jgi:hypothetical protein
MQARTTRQAGRRNSMDESLSMSVAVAPTSSPLV